ncbi:MAG: polyhydroxybutyrate depolymerase [Blastocatellia bacterium]|jgi:poly(3-hydroxybutyrate) depolymerase|nr:polyhydroxybutyrate depolymerase [Blastocatellia bacterium]
MKLRLLLITTLLLLSSTLATAKDDITKELITSNGKTRAYYLYVPSTIKPASPAPLVVMLHGSGRVGMSLVEKWKDLAKKEGFIIAGPDSLDPRIWGMPQDGPEYLRELVEELKKKYPINPRRVYLFGHSGGAIFALLMSLMESQYFAATAIHAGALPPDDADLMDSAKRKIPIFIQVGDSDQSFPLKVVRATRDALNAKGFSAELTEIPGHDHWYYDLAPKINLKAWEFLKSHELEIDPVYRKFQFNE